MKNKRNILLMVIVLSIITLAACTKDNKKNQNSANKTEQNRQVKDSMNKVEDTDKTVSVNDMKVNKNIQETNTTNTMTKIERGRETSLGRLDNIQKEIDALPEKKDSDAGVTNAMRSYYGKSYDMYDRELNEIYALLKKQLSPKTMKNLQAEQIKWIEHKEAEANKEASQYKGGTFEFVAYNLSLYNSTKKRCYELVNKYMTD
ncbi:lysozyme inhibitor LprI family protein [Clostridium tyrobutyricum]|uniref:lysozyme inhibitor LprI family protein n=1 Tax=Clostridium tyrobutyricum TaxID=1519 RepID=UPI002B1FA6C0|nr:lysozyme inhibitor LprI family protein [Clostridium tyrobutyricum]MEA5009639.1 lysozyme inhibitor LprI family protein [Clostridium tyrobutyricum]